MKALIDIENEFRRVVKATEIMLEPQADADKSEDLNYVKSAAVRGLSAIEAHRKELEALRGEMENDLGVATRVKDNHLIGTMTDRIRSGGIAATLAHWSERLAALLEGKQEGGEPEPQYTDPNEDNAGKSVFIPGLPGVWVLTMPKYASGGVVATGYTARQRGKADHRVSNARYKIAEGGDNG